MPPIVLKKDFFMFAITAVSEDLVQIEAVIVDHFQDKETKLPLIDC